MGFFLIFRKDKYFVRGVKFEIDIWPQQHSDRNGPSSGSSLQYPKWPNHPSNGPMSLLKQHWLSADQKNCLSTDLGPFVEWFGHFWCWTLLPLVDLCWSPCCWGLGSIPIGLFCYVLTKNELNLLEDSFLYQTECIHICTQKFYQVPSTSNMSCIFRK